jgi:hypothetical protein
MFPTARQRSSRLRALRRRKCALSLANAISIGLRSGEYGGRNSSPVSLRLQKGLRCFGFVGGKVVEDHNVPGRQAGCQLGFDVSVEDRAVHGPIDHPWRDQLIATQPRDERLTAPVTEGRIGQQSAAARRAPPQPGHLGRRGCLVQKDQPVRFLAHPGLAQMGPNMALTPHPGASALHRKQRLFYMRTRAL